MSYSEFLSKIIKESGYSLRKIASLCERKYNVPITASYLSKLQKGTQTPASDKVNIAIAKVCETNPDDLLFEADFERAPESVKQLVNQMVIYLKNFFKSSANQMKAENPKIGNDFEKEISRFLNMSTREFIQSINAYDDFLTSSNPFEFSLADISETQNTELENMFMKFSIGKTMLDDSMFPIIKQGAKLELEQLSEYKNGDIVSVLLENEKNIIRTYVDAGENVVLIPANNEFETITIPKNKIKINGKVKSYTIDL